MEFIPPPPYCGVLLKVTCSVYHPRIPLQCRSFVVMSFVVTSFKHGCLFYSQCHPKCFPLEYVFRVLYIIYRLWCREFIAFTNWMQDEGTPTLVEVFECQRFVPNLIGGKQWSTKHLLAGRRWQVRNPRSRHDGCFEFRQQFEATLPPGTKWVSEEWHVDGTIGEDGWEYAFDLPVNSPLKLHWVKKARMKDFVRRRRWVRNALVPSHHDYEYDYTADIEEDSAAPENTDDAIAGDVAYLDGDLIADDAYYDDEDDDSDVDAFFFGDSSSSEASSDEDFSPAMPHTPVGDTTDVVH
eukprot:m.268102 g.268102  ORF g.268102 m.268102 type:complete len:296 (-) comp19734_c0_seq24:5274-6161(-)